MAKDGTRRGGARPGAGRKKKNDKNSVKISEKLITQLSDAEKACFPPFNRQLISGEDSFALNHAEDVYYSVYKFAGNNDADRRISKELVELFAVSYSRWVQVEREISRNGFTSAHPTTGAECKSPLVEVSNTYSKQAHNYWYSIWAAVKDGKPPSDDEDDMENLLNKAVSG